MKYVTCSSIDVNKTNPSKECISSQYWNFLNKGFTFDPAVCNAVIDIMVY